MVIASSKARWLVAVGGAVLVALVLLSGVAGARYLGFGQDDSLAHMLSSESHPGLNAVEATREVCKDFSKYECVEGWRTEYGNFMRFAGDGEADYAEVVLGDDCRRRMRVIVDFRGRDLSFRDKEKAIQVLYGPHDWY